MSAHASIPTIHNEPCDCPPGRCAHFVEPDSQCINRLSGDAQTLPTRTMGDYETLDRLFLEISQFTEARTWRDRLYEKALSEIAASNPNKFDDPADHANWCAERARLAVTIGKVRRTAP